MVILRKLPEFAGLRERWLPLLKYPSLLQVSAGFSAAQ